MEDRVELTLSFQLNQTKIVDGREVAREAIRLALRSLATYANGSPEQLHHMFEVISNEISGDFCYRAAEAGIIEHQLLCTPDRTPDQIDTHILKVQAELNGYRTPRPPPPPKKE